MSVREIKPSRATLSDESAASLREACERAIKSGQHVLMVWVEDAPTPGNYAVHQSVWHGEAPRLHAPLMYAGAYWAVHQLLMGKPLRGED